MQSHTPLLFSPLLDTELSPLPRPFRRSCPSPGHEPPPLPHLLIHRRLLPLEPREVVVPLLLLRAAPGGRLLAPRFFDGEAVAGELRATTSEARGRRRGGYLIRHHVRLVLATRKRQQRAKRVAIVRRI